MRVAVLHGYRYSLLWPAPGTAMLVPYAHPAVYLNVDCLHGCRFSDRVQVGRRERCRPLQRSAPRECSEGGAEGAADLYRSESSIRTAATCPEPGAQPGSRVSELFDLRADERSGVHEHGHGHSGCYDTTRSSARRHCSRNARRATRPGRAGEWWRIHDLASGPGYALDSNGRSGSERRDCLPVTRSDLPRPSTFAAVTNSTRPTTLRAPRDALRRGTWRSRVCRGR
jgi:hypothetical protein